MKLRILPVVLLLVFSVSFSFAQGYGSMVMDGPISWGDSMPAIPRIAVFNVSANQQTLTLPADAKYCIIEAWGGGGMGGVTAGGGGAGYVIAKIRNAANISIGINVGRGGMRDVNNNVTDGVGTTVTFTGGNIKADGGASSGINNITNGRYSINITGNNATAYGIFGQPGVPNRVADVTNRNDTTLIYRIMGGNGGNAGNTTATAGIGNDTYVLAKYSAQNGGMVPLQPLNPIITGSSGSSATPGLVPGGGGGGIGFFKPGFVYKPDKSTNGGDGMVIIYY